MNTFRSNDRCRLVLRHFLLITVIVGVGGIGFSPMSFAQPSIKEMLDVKSDQVGEGDKAEIKKTEESRAQKEEIDIPPDEFNRGVPQTSVAGFLRAVRERDFNKAAEYLDLRNLPEGLDAAQGPDLARKFHIVLARTLWVDLDSLSLQPEGFSDDGLPGYRDRLGRIQSDEGNFDLLLQRVPRGDGAFIWKISNRTVGQIPDMYALFGHGRLDEIFPSWFFDYRILEIYVWEWVATIIIGLLSFLVVMGITSPVLFMIARSGTALGDQIVRTFTGPIRFLAWVVIIRYVIELIGRSSLVGKAIYQVGTLLLIALAWFAMRAIDFLAARIEDSLKKKGDKAITVLFSPLRTGCKTMILLITVIFWFDNLGFEVTALLAGLGIGGLFDGRKSNSI